MSIGTFHEQTSNSSFILYNDNRHNDEATTDQQLFISNQQVTEKEDWKNQKAEEFHNQCINPSSSFTTPSSMIIPNDQIPISSQQLYNKVPPLLVDPTSSSSSSSSSFYYEQKLLPSYHLTYSAAAEAAALESLSFNTNNDPVKQPKMMKKNYGEIPEKIKRPPNAYLLFNRDMRRHNVNRGLSSGEISKSISQRWKELPPEQKDHYFKEESKLKEKHNNANIIYTRRSKAEMKEAHTKRASYLNTNSNNNNDNSKKSTTAIASKPSHHHHHHQYVRDPRGRKKNNGLLPKHPMSGYLHFAKEMRPTLKRESPEARLVEISREIGVRWRSLTDQERQPWIELANQDKERYAREMKTHLGQSLFMNDLNLTTKKGGIYELDELDSEVIATVSQMVNPSSHHI